MCNGLTPKETQEIIRFVVQFPEIEEVFLFGSRARNEHRKTSDIDIAILGKKTSFRTVSRLKGLLNEESSLPYFVDVVDFNYTDNQELKTEIERDKILIYSKE